MIDEINQIKNVINKKCTYSFIQSSQPLLNVIGINVISRRDYLLVAFLL